METDLPRSAEIVVVGLGAAGSATLHYLLAKGHDAVGIDQCPPGHKGGSTHGDTRLLRVAYAEGDIFDEAIDRAVVLWRQLGETFGIELFHETGVVYCGPRDDSFIRGAHHGARRRGRPLKAIEATLRPSQIAFQTGWECVQDEEAGYLECEKTIELLLSLWAKRYFIGPRCTGIVPAGNHVLVETDRGTISASRVVVTAGAWTSELVPKIADLTAIERQVLYWFSDLNGQCARAKGFKPFVISDQTLTYGFPTNDAGEVKVAMHGNGQRCTHPEQVSREVGEEELGAMSALVKNRLPYLGPCVRSSVCMYPMAREEGFIIGPTPDCERIILGAGLSGHGFKFAPAIGEALAALATDQKPVIDLRNFSVAASRQRDTI